MKMRRAGTPPPVKMSRPGRAAAPYVAWCILAAGISVAAGSLLPLVLALSGVAHLAAVRAWESQCARRPGSRGALRRARRQAGPATMTELRRNLSLPAARRSVRSLRPSLARTWRLPAHEAGVCLGTASRSAR